MEVGEADDVPIAYLIRPYIPTIDLAEMGPFGLGKPMPELASALPAPSGPILESLQTVDLTYPGGVHLVRASLSDDPLQGGRLRLLLDWSIDASVVSNQPLVWHVAVQDANGQLVMAPDHSGVDHFPSALRGQRLLSMFTLDTPRELGVSPHRAQVTLIDAYTSTALAYRGPNAESGTDWLTPPVTIHPSARCFA
jgi:hypothetical protein